MIKTTLIIAIMFGVVVSVFHAVMSQRDFDHAMHGLEGSLQKLRTLHDEIKQDRAELGQIDVYGTRGEE